MLDKLLPFHKLFFIPVEMTEKDARYCCWILRKQKFVSEK